MSSEISLAPIHYILRDTLVKFFRIYILKEEKVEHDYLTNILSPK